MQIDLSIFQGCYGFAVPGAEFTPIHPKAIFDLYVEKDFNYLVYMLIIS